MLGSRDALNRGLERDGDGHFGWGPGRQQPEWQEGASHAAPCGKSRPQAQLASAKLLVHEPEEQGGQCGQRRGREEEEGRASSRGPVLP